MNADALDAIVDAAEEEEWALATARARALRGPIPLNDIFAMPYLLLRLNRCAVHSGVALREELRRLSVTDTATVALDDFPDWLGERSFEGGCGALLAALMEKRWSALPPCLACVVLLPGATRARAQQIRATVDRLIAAVVAAQDEVLRRDLVVSVGARRDHAALAAIPSLTAVLSQADFYPDLGRRFVCGVLRHAETPILRILNAAFVLQAWPELMDIASSRKDRRGWSPGGLEWLERTAALDPGPFSPDECAEEGES